MKLNFYLRPSRTDLKPIYLFISLKARKPLRMGFSVKEIHWDKKKQRVKAAVSGAENINDVLEKMEKRAQKIYSEMDLPTLDRILKQLEEPEQAVVVPEVAQVLFFPALKRFIEDSRSGQRRTSKGKRIKPLTIKQYEGLQSVLLKYNETIALKISWQRLDLKFYHAFTDYCWDELDMYDNRVGTLVKNLKVFLNWCAGEGIIPHKLYTTKWVGWEEETDIVVLYPDELGILINIDLANAKLERTRDLFLMGCMTCFRVSNLLNLTEANLVENGGRSAIKIISVKTAQPVFINLNEVGKKIIAKYKGAYDTLLPTISDQKFNENLKELAVALKSFLEKNPDKLKAGFIGNDWTKPFVRTRFKRGEPFYSNYEMTNRISSHTMRRTGITNLLMQGLSEIEVKEISGHTFGSKEFGKYEKIATQFIDKKASEAWDKIFA